ncbi:hypothetical protein KIPB_004768, partial [Kipferlia bialata]
LFDDAIRSPLPSILGRLGVDTEVLSGWTPLPPSAILRHMVTFITDTLVEGAAAKGKGSISHKVPAALRTLDSLLLSDALSILNTNGDGDASSITAATVGDASILSAEDNALLDNLVQALCKITRKPVITVVSAAIPCLVGMCMAYPDKADPMLRRLMVSMSSDMPVLRHKVAETLAVGLMVTQGTDVLVKQEVSEVLPLLAGPLEAQDLDIGIDGTLGVPLEDLFPTLVDLVTGFPWLACQDESAVRGARNVVACCLGLPLPKPRKGKFVTQAASATSSTTYAALVREMGF